MLAINLSKQSRICKIRAASYQFTSFSNYWLFPLALLLISVFLLLKKLKQRKTHKQLPPPGPTGLPIIGNLHQLEPLAHRSLFHLSKQYGPVMLLQLGGVPTVIISSADAAKEVFTIHDHNTCSRPLLAGTGRLSYNYLDVAFTPYGDYWREMRKICVRELFSAKRVQSFRFVREEEVGLLIDSISLFAASSVATPVDLSEKCTSLTADITCRVAFGKSFRERGFDNEGFQEVIHEAVAMLGSFSATDLFPYVGWIVDRLTGLHARLERNFKELDVFYQKVIDDHIKGGLVQQEQEDIVDVLLKFQRNQTESDAIQLTQDHIKAILMNIFLPGVDTGAITLVWAMAELARNPRVMRKAQEEIRRCIGPKERIYETDIDQLGYLKMVVKETLRLHPPDTLLLPRETMSPFEIHGYHIDRKTRIQVNVWAIGRDPKTWKNPDKFIPERFIDRPIDFKGQNYELLTFGGGRRGCPGISMGLATVELALANLLFCFDWKLPHGIKEQDINMEEGAGLTIYKKSPLLLVPVKHESAMRSYK